MSKNRNKAKGPKRSKFKEFEVFVAQTIKGMAELDGLRNIKLLHNVQMTGLSGASHQIDVYWEFELAGMTWKSVIQAKDWSYRVDFPTFNSFRGVLEDLGNPRGIMFTRTGYDKGNIDKVAEKHNISLFVIDEFIDAENKHKPLGIVTAIGETLDLTLTGGKLSRKFDSVALNNFMRQLTFDNLKFKGQNTGNVFTSADLKDQAIDFVLAKGIGNSEGEKFVYQPPEPLILTLIEFGGPKLEIVEIQGIAKRVETSRVNKHIFATHLIRSVTGDKSFVVDNLGRVHRSDSTNSDFRSL
ncbi:MAG: hypothetical protein QG625_834 [Cyanobacteriota bacterium erpe_2018_sw_39hr_WHONDRS-SW48-000098_B_bin.30]|jgi:hypothetical protein|nr:restriction endonuclease [Candidatus Obscuribacter sp.]MDQ5964680.1 hypothetical protein [Cyanobacteriota bacterium erpe_2018_sw_39hr_WHONDRS-SW48-000098_B_bin.30]